VNTVEARHVRKSFRSVQGLRGTFRRSDFDVALAGIDISIAQGEIFGLLGPNGAGKTTLIKILCGLIIADEGEVRIAGHEVVSDGIKARRSIGVVYGDERSFHWRLSVRDNLRFFARLYRMPKRTVDPRINELLSMVGLAHAADKKMLGFSSGMKQRASIARGLLHDPPVILMDEPTRMLDPIGAFEIHSLIREQIATQGRTVLVATNLMTEAEVLCDRLLLIDRGRPVLKGTVEEFRAAIRRDIVYRFLIEGPVGEALNRLWVAPGVREAKCESVRAGVAEVVVAFDSTSKALPSIIRVLVDAGAEIISCSKEDLSLDQVFRTIVIDRPEAVCAG
jgi:ABC-2 type transport system ATP-binding protein